jgi:hypothetical protein
MYTKGKWIIDGSQIVSVEKEINNSNETICELNPETEYPTVFERNPGDRKGARYKAID